ncbi:MAG: TIGR02757 family protein [Saprospiraceae bacterium]|nr:TIGR02757 family protein [Saprospiraceae bacterium]
MPNTLSLKFNDNLKSLLDEYVERFNRPEFIADDPISIPHRFSNPRDIEITAFWTAILAWGQRKSIINSANRLFEYMDNAPYDFIKNHQETDRKRFEAFKHRTFQPIDALYFLEFLQQFYNENDSLETAFARHLTGFGFEMSDFGTLPTSDILNPKSEAPSVSAALIGFNKDFFDLPDAPHRTRKHVSTPLSKSTCKRLCMFLRWMVRRDDCGVDFGIWQTIKPSQLLMPLDVHVERHARRLGLLERPQTDWQTVLELTKNLRQFDPEDPVKYDFALFGMGIVEKKEFADFWDKVT